MMWEPIRFLESCPSSDGACAVVLHRRGRRQGGGEPTAARRRGSSARRRAASRRASPGATRCDPQAAVDCAEDVYGQAGITNPREQIDMAELYVPFSLARADLAGRPRHRRRRRGLEDDRRRRDRDRRLVPGQLLGRRALEQPDRRVGPAALRRGGAPGARRWPASTRSRAPTSPSVRPTARTASTSACGSSPARSIPSDRAVPHVDSVVPQFVEAYVARRRGHDARSARVPDLITYVNAEGRVDRDRREIYVQRLLAQ